MRTGLRATLLVVAAGMAVASAGCMNAYKERVNQALWERELRLQEDCIYRLKWELEDKQRELDDANQRAGTAKKEADVFRDENRSSSGPDLGAPPPFNPLRGGSTEAPKLPPAPGLPEVEPGLEVNPSAPSIPYKGPTGSGASSTPGELFGPALSQAAYTESADQPAPLEKLNPDVDVDRISLDPGLTGSLDTRGASQDELLSVTIQLRDAHDKRVLAPGDVAIVVMDPALEGRAARIARWDFDSDEVAKHVRRNHDGGSLQFELPWSKPPEHSDLRLYVRFTTFDGRRLEANLPIDVKLASSKANGWTKAKSTSTLHESDADQPNAVSADAPKTSRSVYDRNRDNTDSDTDNKTSHETTSSRPTWSPYR